MTVLLRTIHGSHLYGLNHALSDEDFYEVLSDDEMLKLYGREAVQVIKEGTDITTVGFSEFVRQCNKGVPQALEALYSPVKQINNLQYFVDSYRYGGEAVSTYIRTVRSFTLDKRESKQPKLRVHAVRLVLNLNMLLENGRFNPTMALDEIELLTAVKKMDLDETVNFIQKTSLMAIFR